MFNVYVNTPQDTARFTGTGPTYPALMTATGIQHLGENYVMMITCVGGSFLLKRMSLKLYKEVMYERVQGYRADPILFDFTDMGLFLHARSMEEARSIMRASSDILRYTSCPNDTGLLPNMGNTVQKMTLEDFGYRRT